MKRGLALAIVVITLLLVSVAWVQAGGWSLHTIRSANTPQEAVQALLTDVQSHNWDGAYSRLGNHNDVEEQAFIRDVAGSNGSLRTFSSLENFNTWPLHANADQATIRVKMNWTSAVGPVSELRDLNVQKQGSTWKVLWPKPGFSKLPPQVIPVNYLRWDVIGRTAGDDWGVQNVDTPRVRITSMNAIERPDRVVIVGEVVNEDTIPAYVNVNATLLKPDDTPLDEEGSFDMISHTLLPKQVSPYRIDFPGLKLKQVKSVRMDAKALLVPASDDPVIAVTDQNVEKDALGKNILHGNLINQSGQSVDIAQVLAAYYDSNGKVIWVSNGYVDQALRPQISVPFGVEIPDDVAPNVQSYHVLVNHYSNTAS
jgi:hypothetical protein